MDDGRGLDVLINPQVDSAPNGAEAEDRALLGVFRQEQVRSEAQILAFDGVLVEASDVTLFAISENDLARQWVQPETYDLGSVPFRLQNDPVDFNGFHAEQIALGAGLRASGAWPYSHV